MKKLGTHRFQRAASRKRALAKDPGGNARSQFRKGTLEAMRTQLRSQTPTFGWSYPRRYSSILGALELTVTNAGVAKRKGYCCQFYLPLERANQEIESIKGV